MTRFAELLEGFFYRPDEDVGVLLDLPDSAEDGPEAVKELPQEYLAFWLEQECYAVAIHDVREIVRVPPLTEVPRSASQMLGVMNLRGEVLPVYDIKPRLRLGSGQRPMIAGPEADLYSLPRSARVVVLRMEEGDTGILVDTVADVIRLLPSQIEPPPAGVGSRDCVVGLGRKKDRLFILLDVRRVIQ